MVGPTGRGVRGQDRLGPIGRGLRGRQCVGPGGRGRECVGPIGRGLRGGERVGPIGRGLRGGECVGRCVGGAPELGPYHRVDQSDVRGAECRGLAARHRVRREVGVDARADPQWMDRHVGQVGQCRHVQPPAPAQPAQDVVGQRVGGHGRGGAGERAVRRAAGEHRAQPADERHHRPGPQHRAQQSPAARRLLDPAGVHAADGAADTDREQVEELVAGDGVAGLAQPPGQFVGDGVVAAADAGRHDRDGWGGPRCGTATARHGGAAAGPAYRRVAAAVGGPGRCRGGGHGKVGSPGRDRSTAPPGPPGGIHDPVSDPALATCWLPLISRWGYPEESLSANPPQHGLRTCRAARPPAIRRP